MITISCEIERSLDEIGEAVSRNLSLEVMGRAARVSNELTNAVAFILRGARHGRRYLIPGTRRHYTASAPGEAPAVRTGVLRASFMPKETIENVSGNDFTAHSSTDSNVRVNGYHLSTLLEKGTKRHGKPHILPRPHADPIVQRALPNVMRIYQRPYNVG